jgi:DnaJ domain
MIEAERYYRVLDLEPGASAEEVHQGYLDLTWVWHPDRFVGHPRLQQKAHCKLQELNEAHARLRLCHPTSHKKDLGTPSKVVSTPDREQVPADGWHKSYATQSVRENEQRIPTGKPPVRNKGDVGEWLD